MGSNNLAPNNSDFRTVLLLRCTVDESDALAEVELGLIRGLNALNLDERNVGVRDALGTLVAQVAGLSVQPCVSGHFNCITLKDWYTGVNPSVSVDDFSATNMSG